MRNPAYQVLNKYQNAVSQLKVKEYKINRGITAQIDGMPHLFKGNKNADTLEVILYDEPINFEVHLYYTVFDEYDIIARNVIFVNKSDMPIEIMSAYSVSLDLPVGDYDMVHSEQCRASIMTYIAITS